MACSSDDGNDGGNKSGAVSAACDGAVGDAALECEILKLVNQERAKGANCGGQNMPSVPALEMHPTLRGTARAHAKDMASNSYFSHTSQDGRSSSQRMSDAGYKWRAAGENIAAGSPTAEATMQQWMGSPGHCSNIMGGNFVHLGVGYAFADTNKYRHLWVQNFGAPQ